MSMRKQKIALYRRINTELLKLVKQPNSPIVRAEIRNIMITRCGDAFVDVDMYPIMPVKHIDIKIGI